eukprot:CAMPEP_0197834254 /NCGR_PEP_ID=MMETSP1437-20131217/21784_1 /TAXON_ID=49252 ORGANISM="Eucampia antarctica, Strain CCMP1452" /NCGR_SAMPLE_ID=MMETSP1437 /ASSEMBLY_ACC=CAM_ASM_001096 /LENGTH=350 /DNA_ID=CAMNT_0043438803 /DNA_START=38 /DNA_END=1087 /DNA_ORIENTATION=+
MTTSSSTYGALNVDATLIQTPMIMAHNAATVYMTTGSLLAPGNLYGKNQGSGETFSDLLNCGARALDLEIFDDSQSEVAFQHGIIGKFGDVTLESGLANILSWSTEHPQELVLLSMDCPESKDKCSSRVKDILKASGIDYITNCTMIESMTLKQALEMGSVLAVSDTCVTQNYDEDLSCHGFLPSVDQGKIDELIELFATFEGKDDGVAQFIGKYDDIRTMFQLLPSYTCWEDDSQKNFADIPFWDYLEKTLADHQSSETMWEWQALWQVKYSTGVLGLNQPRPLPESMLSLKPSSIIDDIEKSELNKKVFDYINKQNASNFNLITVDAVCNDYGRRLIEAIRPTNENTD